MTEPPKEEAPAVQEPSAADLARERARQALLRYKPKPKPDYRRRRP
jgi:hypothetical protein